MTTATHPTKSRKRTDTAPLDRLQDAVGDVERMTERATGDLRQSLESATTRIRDAAADLRKRAGDEAAEVERTLESATEDVRREVARRAVRAQRSPDALTELSTEIRRRRGQLRRAEKAAAGRKAARR